MVTDVKHLRLLGIFVACVFAFIGYIGWRDVTLSRELGRLSAAMNRSAHDSATAFSRLRQEKAELSARLEAEQKRNGTFEEQIKEISGTVGTLEKLSRTDKELLMKYSKVYFLNENYAPDRLMPIDAKWAYDKKKALKLEFRVRPHLEDMLRAAESAGIDLRVASAYRSFGDQAALKTGYTVVYGAGTSNKFSADQGYSEHQLGTAVDLLLPSSRGLTLAFGSTDAYEWLQKNAYRYGFAVSYPKGNIYYQYEPWHWRFVGLALAARLHDDTKNFYDLDQREIDKYLVSFFDGR